MRFGMVNIFWPRVTPKVKGQGQTLKTLKSNISKRYEIERKCQWELNRKSYMGFQMVKIYMTSYLTPIDTFSLYRTVFEIFDIKVFRVWPWPLTFRGHPRSKIFQQFESSYMTSYLTPIWHFLSISYRFEIFDFKVFKVWPWPFDL